MKGFVLPGRLEDDPPEVAALWAHGCRGVVQRGTEIVAWFEDVVTFDDPELANRGRWEDEGDVDWLARYYEDLAPVRLTTLVVAPTHAPVEVTAGQRTLWLDPGMAFGTGHHPTTRRVLEGLEALDLRGARVLDVGAGSGILAVAADLLGAASAHGVDVDPATVPVARGTAARNRSRATFEVGELAPDRPAHRADVLCANLFAEAHVALAATYARALPTGGTLLAAGVLTGKADAVAAAFADAFDVTARTEEDTWTDLVAVRR